MMRCAKSKELQNGQEALYQLVAASQSDLNVSISGSCDHQAAEATSLLIAQKDSKQVSGQQLIMRVLVTNKTKPVQT